MLGTWALGGHDPTMSGGTWPVASHRPGLPAPLLLEGFSGILHWALRSRPKHEERWVLATIETLAGPTA